MSKDPIRGAVGVVVERVVGFVAWGFVIVPMVVWLWIFLGYFEVPIRELWAWTRAAWMADYMRWLTAMWWLCVVFGVAFTSSVYLGLGLWWRGRSDVRHRRGARRDWEHL